MVSEKPGLVIPEGGRQTPHQTTHSSQTQAGVAYPDLQGVGLWV